MVLEHLPPQQGLRLLADSTYQIDAVVVLEHLPPQQGLRLLS